LNKIEGLPEIFQLKAQARQIPDQDYNHIDQLQVFFYVSIQIPVAQRQAKDHL
jgi:hypothetical protein